MTFLCSDCIHNGDGGRRCLFLDMPKHLARTECDGDFMKRRRGDGYAPAPIDCTRYDYPGQYEVAFTITGNLHISLEDESDEDYVGDMARRAINDGLAGNRQQVMHGDVVIGEVTPMPSRYAVIRHGNVMLVTDLMPGDQPFIAQQYAVEG